MITDKLDKEHLPNAKGKPFSEKRTRIRTSTKVREEKMVYC